MPISSRCRFEGAVIMTRRRFWWVALYGALFASACCTIISRAVLAQSNNGLSFPGFEGLTLYTIADSGGGSPARNHNDPAGNCIIESNVVPSGSRALEAGGLATGSQGKSIVYGNAGSSAPSKQVENTTCNCSFRGYRPSTNPSGSIGWAFCPSGSLDEDQPGAAGTITGRNLAASTCTQLSGSFRYRHVPFQRRCDQRAVSFQPRPSIGVLRSQLCELTILTSR